MAIPWFMDADMVCNVLWLWITSVVFVGVCVVNGLASSSSAAQFGFLNATEDISDDYYTQVTPPGYSFLLWGVVYAWQVLWIGYAWSFVCRPDSQQTIFTGVYVGYNIVNCLNIAWIYLWGNNYVVVACVIQILLNLFFYSTIGLLFGYFNHVKNMSNSVDRWLTRIFVQNGLCFYSAWTTILSITNLSAAIPANSVLSDEDCSTLCLTLLAASVITYFLLENTLLDRYGFRYVFSVYPVVIWFSLTLLIEQWDQINQKRNSIYTASLLGLSVLTAVVRVFIVIIFFRYRKHK